MSKNIRLFTSESVTAGHPDKVCDQISDAVLDACLSQDSYSRVACETSINENIVLVMGEITTKAKLNIPDIVRSVISEIGYKQQSDGFDLESCNIIVSLKKQSPDIAVGVNKKVQKSIGAGDQGMMFGYACNETKEYMPFAIAAAHRMARKLESLRKEQTLPYLKPDGKTQVTVEYNQVGRLARVDAIVISTQHSEGVLLSQIQEDMMNHVISACIPAEMLDEHCKIFINPTGRFVIGGPASDSGLTGRKVIVDTYGGYARHGGGAFSGKDYTKVDRSAAYAARYVAKNMVAAGMANKCEIQLSYAIGVSKPVSVSVDTFGTGVLPDYELADIAAREFDLTPEGIIENLQLDRAIYRQTAAYGHFGRTDVILPWERLDMVDVLGKYISQPGEAINM